ncbi:MAG: hypothetical protein Q9N67_00150 [Ghiorsea sp.]|nr:hypothetical protein [Ghiorsea sp.]
MIRGIFIISLMIWVIALNEFLPTFLLCLMCFYILHIQGFTRVNFLRSFYALTWLFLPIFIFHGFFTPGIMVQYPFYLPVSEEGLLRALHLSIHLGLVFFAALIAFRVFSKAEWFTILDRTKYASDLKPYVYLIAALRIEMMQVLQCRKKEWLEMEDRWFQLPQVLFFIIHNMISQAKEQAFRLWTGWDLVMREVERGAVVLSSTKCHLYWVSMMLGWAIFCLI